MRYIIIKKYDSVEIVASEISEVAAVECFNLALHLKESIAKFHKDDVKDYLVYDDEDKEIVG